MQKFPLTVVGANKLRAELEELKTVVRPRIIQAISEARAHGDLKENAEYHAAREQQSFAEGRIAEIEGKLSNANIIDVTKTEANGKVVFGATVEIEDLDSGKTVTYQIVGEDEANIKEGRISVGSPIARALIGKEVEDVVTVKAPGGNIEYEILSVQYI
ncbi:transcription elongation factor GreA [Methylomonas sp. MO1]|jgi:transcription elongation factor GreA|uniref:Transcription elongation factor GreA n=4 Tax=Methylomonas TaxID=416 RepID=A0A177M2J2_METMH|nr:MULTISPECIES: transcription elongation factor GreA [Methylomonas]MBD9360757.1 transcription elongation factor GreA [Methylomonas fluvii]MCQ8119175.1 transcription elongation factor GreA [Methylomonas sp. WSC-7]MDT4290684.1 transcription elongation factor GreA [Methylomonas sp. MO1]MDX8129843.1 transcription elongation factor GreA [Methylomonas sp. OY6]NOV30576.1 transcription elongation factor GreA [Methylomonas sp. ZR1]